MTVYVLALHLPFILFSIFLIAKTFETKGDHKHVQRYSVSLKSLLLSYFKNARDELNGSNNSTMSFNDTERPTQKSSISDSSSSP